MIKLLSFILLLLPFAVFANDYETISQQIEIIQIQTKLLKETIETQNVTSTTVSIIDIIENINSTLIKIGNLVDTVKNVTEETGGVIQDSIKELTGQITTELDELNIHLTVLLDNVSTTVQNTNVTINAINTTLRNVNRTISSTISFITSFGGKFVSGFYYGKNGLDSVVDVYVWKETVRYTSPRYSYLRLTFDGFEKAEHTRFSGIIGTATNRLSIGTGYIEDGLGIDFGFNQFVQSGIDGRISFYRITNLGVNAELGYRPPVINGMRLFISAKDCIQNMQVEGGVAYEKTFNLRQFFTQVENF